MRAEKLGELAAEFDAIHSVERAVEVGSVDRIVPAAGPAAGDLDRRVERGARARRHGAGGSLSEADGGPDERTWAEVVSLSPEGA